MEKIYTISYCDEYPARTSGKVLHRFKGITLYEHEVSNYRDGYYNYCGCDKCQGRIGTEYEHWMYDYAIHESEAIKTYKDALDRLIEEINNFVGELETAKYNLNTE